jgi:class 3 adenylate cyclase
MDPVAAGAEARDTRILAAIVFTDVVGFSRLAAQNEARVYVALQRDLGVMTNLCRAHGGQVLNTMGDGMLMCFMSAVDAMTCAIEIQRTLFNQSLSLPAKDILQHRIGVHLGDVIMSGDNVFGDGVNVAARLQTVAKPGGICFSHTVYEVVRNKLDLREAAFVGNQQLKNLGQPTKIWQIPPHEDRRKAATAVDLPTPEPVDTGASGFKGFAMIAGSIVLLGGVVATIMNMKPPPAAMPKARTQKPKADEPKADTPSVSTPSSARFDRVKFASEVKSLRDSYRFAEAANLIRGAGEDAPEADRSKVTTYEDLQALMQYLDGQLARATIAAPHRFEGEIDGMPAPFEVWMGDRTGMLKARINGTMSDLAWAQLTPSNVAALAAPLVESQLHQTGPAPAAARDWLTAFQSEFGLAPLSSPSGGGTVPLTPNS